MKIHRNQQQAVTLVGAMIILVILFCICALFVSAIAKLAKKVNGGGTGGDTNAPTFFEAEIPADAEVVAVLKFPEMPTPVGSTEASPLGQAVLVIERSTNLVDWQPIWRGQPPINPFDVDTNRPWPQAFYRGRLLLP